MTKKIDANGFWHIEDNPISKEGIYPYYGRQISPTLDPDKIYKVFRPREELRKAADTFKNVPILNDHTMVGKDFTPMDDLKEHGVLGERVYEKDGTLYSNIVVRTDELKNLIQNGKKELSMGYQCTYELTPGIWQGQRYDAVQRDLVGNHVALVQNGRMGHDVRVMDSKDAIYACDSFDISVTDFEESKIKRDKDGKFSSNGGNNSSATYSITGHELGTYKDIKELRQKAVEYYKANLQGKTVKNPELGDVLFTNKGLKKFINSSADEAKIKTLPAVSYIIKKGDYLGEEDLNHPRQDGIIKFHRVSAPIIIDRKKYTVSVLIGEDRLGRKFYNLNPYGENYEKEEVLGTPTVQGQASKTSTDSIDNKIKNVKDTQTTISEMLETDTDGLNIFIEEDLDSTKTNGASGKDAAPAKESKEMDKREAIREIMAISAKPVTEFQGGEEEKVETIAKLAEKLAYNPSETGANDEVGNVEPKKEEGEDACGKDAESEDKRKLIDEIGGILKGKVDEEIWRTIIGKAEKLAYEDSEASADDEDDVKKEDKKSLSMDEMEKELVKRIHAKNSLADKLKPFIGAFDHNDMTLKDMAVYACEKLGKQVAQDEALSFINGYVAAAKKPSANVVMDEALSFENGSDAAFEAFLKGE